MKSIYFFIIILLAVAIVFLVLERREEPDILDQFAYDAEREDFSVIKGTAYFVSPSGDDANDGRSEESALLTIQKAVDMLMPGDGVILSDGVYLQDFSTVRDGEEGRLIVIKGSREAVVKGFGERDRVVEIHHSNIVLNGFTIDGLGGGDGSDEKHYRDKLIYVEGLGLDRGVTGLKIIGMHLTNAGGECLRLKYFSRNNEIAYNRISHCGIYDFRFDGGGKNGEGIYVGTAPEQIRKGKNPTKDDDASNNNWIHNNVIDTQGNECIDIKEGSSDNVVEQNICTGQKDPESGGLDSRGNNNVFRKNEVFDNAGAGIRLGGDEDTDGIENSVIENYLHDNGNGGIKIQRYPQKKICGNVISGNKKGDFVGSFGEDVANHKECGW